MYAFPSLFCLHQLNALLVFIPLWAFSTYLNWKHGKVSLFRDESSIVYYLIGSMVLIYFLNSYGMEICDMVGLCHYPIPGFKDVELSLGWVTKNINQEYLDPNTH